MYSAGTPRKASTSAVASWPVDPPDRVVHAVVGAEVVDRRVGRDGAAQPIDGVGARVGQEHDAGLRAQLDDVARAIVFLVAAACARAS